MKALDDRWDGAYNYALNHERGGVIYTQVKTLPITARALVPQLVA